MRDWALSLYRWSFAQKIKQLGELSNPPIRPLPHVYAMPQDVVGQVFAYRTSASVDGQTVRARVYQTDAGAVIASQAAPLFAEYTCLVDEGQWPAWFTEFVVETFAAGVARAKGDGKMAAAMWDRAVGSRFDADATPGGLLFKAQQSDSIDAPERNLAGWDPGPLVATRSGLCGPGGGLVLITGAEPTFIDFTEN